MEKLKTLLGFSSGIPDYDEILYSLHRETYNKNFFFHLMIVIYEMIMVITISLRPGGPFVKPRRTAYFCLYLILILVTTGIILAEKRINRDQDSGCRHYIRLQNAYMVFFSLWGVSITLNDQLGGNGLTVFIYIILLMAILLLMKPWQTALLLIGNFVLLNVLLPYFPDPTGLDNTFNYFMNSLFLVLAAIVINTTLYNSKIQTKRDEITIKKQYHQIEVSNAMLSREALFDALTGLGNRNSFNRTVRQSGKDNISSFACIYIDVNGLHEINNYLGHQAGDVMLKTAARLLLENFSPEEIFRIGGDEFVVLCSNITQDRVVHRIDTICRQTAEAGYSFSVGYEWRDSNLDIRDIIQTAENDMRRKKGEYYSAQGGERQKRALNEQMELIISEKKDAERFLSILAPVFKGVYFVDLETDTLRQLFIPDYFKEMLEQSDNHFSRALLLYADRMVEPQYRHLFDQFCDYSSLEKLLEGDDIPGFTYQKTDGSLLRMRVLKFSHFSSNHKETLWIFSDTEGNELFS